MGVTAAIAAVAGTAYSVYSGERAASAQASAQKQNLARANETAKQQEEATNRANQKDPDSSAILSAIQQAGKAGASGTMLTGSQGVDTSSLTLGKNVLLGS